MNVILKKENLKLLLSSIIYLVLGVLFCALLGRMVDFSETALCFVFLIVGAVLILVYGILPAEGKIPKVLIYGIVLLVVGLLILMVRVFFIIALAVIIAYGGVQSILDSVRLRKENKSWISEVVIGSLIVALAIAVIILNRTNVAKNIVAVFLGVTFLVEAIYELVSFVKLAKALGEQSVVENKETDSFGENEQIDVAQPNAYETAKQNEKTQDKTSQLKKTEKKVVSKNKSIKK